MNERYDRFVERAIAAIDKGFTSKASKKDATTAISRAYDDLTDSFREKVFDLFEGDRFTCDHEEWTKFIVEVANGYDLPMYPHLIREKHLAKVEEVDAETADKIRFLVELRNAVTEAPINKPVPKSNIESEYEEKVRVVLADILAKRKTQYLRGIELGELFGYLPVTCNTHMVTNAHGTTFVRTFYYLNGELTPLNVIIAAAEELERREEG